MHARPGLSHSQLLQLKRWNTPTIYNGWEQITSHDPAQVGINLEPTTDFMPQMGPMVGYAVTVVVEPSNPQHPKDHPDNWVEFYRHVAGQPDVPLIIVMQDLDKPNHRGSCWGEVNANIQRALGCVGCIVDGCIRDLDEMTNAGFKALASRLAVGHAHAVPLSWGEPVQVFGQTIHPGQLIHADKHGFLAIPPEDEPGLLDASVFMDRNECDTLIACARSTAGLTKQQIADNLAKAAEQFGRNATEKFGRGGEFGDE